MKTRSKLLLALGLLAIFCVGYIIGIIVDYPRPSEENLAGTVGKAKKYQKSQMTARDVELRTDLTKDTAQLKNMIQGLVHFSVLSEDVSDQISLSVVSFRTRGMGALPEEQKQLQALEDYALFIRNNNEALNGTIGMLTSLYLQEETDQSLDIEKNLRDFGAYVNNLNERSTQLTQGITTLDQFLLNNEGIRSHKESLQELKSIRDQLLIKSIQFNGSCNLQEVVINLIGSALVGATAQNATNQAQADLQRLVGVVEASGNMKINSVYSMDKFNLTEAMIYYDKAGLNFQIDANPSQSDLHVAAAMTDLQLIAVFANQNLNLVFSDYTLDNLVGSRVFNYAIGATNCGIIIDAREPGLGLGSTSGFQQAANFVQSLGYVE